jgi:transcription elongation factor GreA
MATSSVPTASAAGVVYLTPAGQAALEEERTTLRTQRETLLHRIQEEREYGAAGQLHEASTDRDQLALVEGRLRVLEDALRHAVLVTSHDAATVSLGATVRIVDQDGVEERVTIVGSREARPAEGRISNESPVGRSLLRRRVGETVAIRVPAGTVTYTVLEIA